MNNKDEKKKASGTDDEISGRRKLLKSVVAGGGAATVAKMLPDQWARPVVDSIMLPSHAQTSNSPFGPFATSAPITTGQLKGLNVQMADQGFSEELLEFFTPAAHAVHESTVIAESMSFSANESGNSYLCATHNATTEMISVAVSGNPPSFTSSECLWGFPITGGNYEEGVGWNVQMTINVSTDITLVSGGAGCSGGIPGHCYGG